MFGLALRVGIIVAIIALIIWILRGIDPIRIVVSSGKIRRSRGLSEAEVRKLDEFFEQEFILSEDFVIKGNRDEQGRITLDFSQNCHAEDAQRIRNFVTNEL